jgi:hypothetical protein
MRRWHSGSENPPLKRRESRDSFASRTRGDPILSYTPLLLLAFPPNLSATLALSRITSPVFSRDYAGCTGAGRKLESDHVNRNIQR